MPNFQLSEIERVCRRHSKCDEIGKYSSDRVEIIVGKGEIDLLEQFLPFPQYFTESSATKW
jgi:hypothetical protein